MLFLTLMLASAPAAAQDPSPQQLVYDMAVTCASTHMVASVIQERMGDAEGQAQMRRLADNFEQIGVGMGERLGRDRETVLAAMAAEAAARTAPLQQIGTSPNRQAAMADWTRELNVQIDECRAFALDISGAPGA